MKDENPLQSMIDRIIGDNKEEMAKTYWDLFNFGTSVTTINDEGKIVRVDPRTVKLEDL